MIDFASLDKTGTRLSVGATDIETGTLQFFDSHQMEDRFGPEHVVASSSLPPGFPATLIGGRQYWDGGCVLNTPLDAVLRDTPTSRAVVFVIDLWNAPGPAPDTMAAVEWRTKQIRYTTTTFDHVHAVKAKLQLLVARPMLSELRSELQTCRFDIVHIIYNPGNDQIPASDAEFSRSSIMEPRAAGLEDMRRALVERPWQRPETPGAFRLPDPPVDPRGGHYDRRLALSGRRRLATIAAPMPLDAPVTMTVRVVAVMRPPGTSDPPVAASLGGQFVLWNGGGWFGGKQF